MLTPDFPGCLLTWFACWVCQWEAHVGSVRAGRRKPGLSFLSPSLCCGTPLCVSSCFHWACFLCFQLLRCDLSLESVAPRLPVTFHSKGNSETLLSLISVLSENPYVGTLLCTTNSLLCVLSVLNPWSDFSFLL